MGENYIYISKQAMTIFPENNEEIKYKSSFNFDNDFSKMDFNLNPYMEYISKENAILETDKNINFFPLNQFELPYEEEKKPNTIFLIKKRIFKVEYPLKDLRCGTTKCFELNEDDESNFIKKKRSKKRQKRYTYKDLIQQKIKRNFFNGYLVIKLNEILKTIKSGLLFKKFPKRFTNNVSKNDNKRILLMTLGEIIKDKNLYKNDLKIYEHNLKVINELKEEKSKINEILETKNYYEIYEDYLNSDEYKINIEKIKQKYKGKNEYIKKYICLSKHFLELFEL
jgi:hypothetical protein